MSLSTRLTRQTVWYISAAAMAALAMILLAPAAQAQSVSVTIDDQSALDGDTISVPIEVSGLDQAEDITAYGFDIDLGTNVSYVGFESAGTLSGDADFEIDDNADVPRIGAFGQDALNSVADSGVLLSLQLEVSGTGTSSVTLTDFEFNGGTPPSDPAEPSFQVEGANKLVSFPDEFAARDSGQAEPADTVLVPISASNLTAEDSVTAFGFEMTYDSSILEPTDVVKENALSSGFTADGSVVSDGVFRVGAFGSPSLQGSGTLLFIEMEVVGQGTSELSFVPGTFEFNDGTPVAATQNGSLDATGLDFLLGDPTMNGTVSALDASLTLRSFLDAQDTTLTSPAQRAAADVDGDEEITPDDASLILQVVVGLEEGFPAASGSSASKALASTGRLEWGSVESSGQTPQLPVRLSGSVSGVQAVSLTLTGDVGAVNMDGLSDRLPQGWMLMHRTYEGEGKAKIAMAGAEPIADAGELVRLPLGDETASIEASGTLNGSAQTALGAAPTVDRPGSFTLQGNFPNPVTQSTTITFDAPQKASVEVEVYDMLGRRVLSTSAQTVSAGEGRSIQIDANDLSSGAYIYRLKAEADGGQSDSWTDSGRMTVVK